MAGGTKPRAGTRRTEKFQGRPEKSRPYQNTASRRTGPRQPDTFVRHEGLATAEKSTAMITAPVLQIRHTPQDEWFVAAKWPDGRTEDIRGFKTESEANEWVVNELQAWLDERKGENAHA